MSDEIETIEAEAPRRGRPPKAAEPAEAVIPDGYKLARVLKKGDGKVAKGFTVEGEEQYFAKGDEVVLPASIADALEDRGFVET